MDTSIGGTRVHINIPTGQFFGQVRLRGHRNWTTVGGPRKNAKTAMIAAVKAMGPNHKRARVLFCAEWYEPTIVMELNR